MSREILFAILLAISLFLVIVIYDVLMTVKNKNRLIKDIEKNFGKNQIKSLPQKYDSIVREFGKNIDDITFNDLELKLFLKKYNHSYSSFGMDYFYYRIRNQYFSPSDIEREIRYRKLILDNEDSCKKTLFYFANIGYFKESLFDFINSDIEIEPEYKALTYIFSFSIVYIIISIILFKELAIFIALSLVLLNTYISNKVEREANVNLNSIINLKSMYFLANSILKDNNEIFKDELRDIDEILNRTKDVKKSIRTFKFLTGNLDMDFAENYKNIIFLSKARALIKSSKHVKNHRDDLKKLYFILGSIESKIIATSIFKANDLKNICIVESKIEAKALVNPIVENCVPNDLNLEKSILLTGSNASGKSTYLRTVGINEILATTFGFFFGEELNTELIVVKSVIDISDSIEKNISYFVAEANAIKRLIDDRKKLILLDEIFRGTNTIDRISAATYTLRYLNKNNYIISATHDIELTTLLNEFRNAHFEEIIKDRDISFDYLLKEGPTNSKNAIAILNAKNYPSEIIEGAIKLSHKLEER